jgi:tetratricopeptide (TPR) repeat protein
MLACGLLLIIAAGLVLFLPLVQKDRDTGPQLDSQDARTVVPPPRPQRQAAPNDDSTREIDRLIGVWLQKQAEAEAENIAAWGGDAYTEAVSLARECDRLLGEKQYLPAKASCEGAIDGLDDLMASQDTLLEDAVTDGLLALEQGDADAAAGHFQQALAINGDDKRALSGVQRAEQLPAVLRFLQDGLAMENANDPDGALVAFTEAATRDPDFVPAQEAVARVRAEIAEREFQQAMSRSLQAMADGKLSAARSALQKAESIRPGDRAVRDLKQQLSRTQLTGRLAALRQEAERLEQEERWPEALKSCKEALSLDSHAAFAASCKERVGLRIDLDRRLKTILAKPERLFEDGPMEEARQTLAHATEVPLRGPVLATQIGQLEKLITQAEAEIEVVILSDGLTDVVVYHIGRLGRFQEKRLVLRTGDYTATGSRDGFRDVRQTLKVRPGFGKMVFTLRCEEPI